MLAPEGATKEDVEMKSVSKPRLLLLGGGHAHAVLLRDRTREEFSRFDATLVSEGESFVYSGMIPALIEGRSTFREIAIDLQRLCSSKGVHFHRGRVDGFDGHHRSFSVSGEPFSFDLASINMGGEVVSDFDYSGRVRPIKPVAALVKTLDELEARNEKVSVLVLGGGASGCECAAALASRFRSLPAHANFRVILLERSERVLKTYSERLSKTYSSILSGLGVQVECGVRAISDQDFQLSNGESLRLTDVDLLVLSTPSWAPSWFAKSFAMTKSGKIRIESTLETSIPNVFAIGDTAAREVQPWPASGVYAIRASKILWANFIARANGSDLKSFYPQKTALSLLSAGHGRAVGEKGRFYLPYSRATGWLKSRIDRGFLDSFRRPGP